MTTEERISQLEAALALSQAKVAELATALAQAVEQRARADAANAQRQEVESRAKEARRERNRRYHARWKASGVTSDQTSSDVSQDANKTSDERLTPPPPPLAGSPPPSVPSSPSPISSPPTPFSSPDAPASAGQSPLPGLGDEPFTPPAKQRRKRATKKPDPDTDPRHHPLKLALVAAGWPFDGGRDADNLKAIIAIADQQEATTGSKAHAEILRRASVAWSAPGFDCARSLTEFRNKWARYAENLTPLQQPRQQAQDVTRGVVRAEDMRHDGPGDLRI